MDNILDNNIFDSLYEQLKLQLIEFKSNDKNQIKLDDEEYIEKIEDLDELYTLYDEKLEFIKKLSDNDNQTKSRFLSIIKKVNGLAQRNDRQKVLMSLSYAVLVDYFKRIHERTDEEIIMLSSCSTGLDLDDYTYYIGILSDENISEAIINKTNNIKEQVNIAYDIMDAQDEFDYDFITRDNYDILVNNGLNIIKSYKINEKKVDDNIMANERLICKDCGKEFEFPATITVNDLFNQGMNLEDAKKLLATRDSIKSIIDTVSDEKEKKRLENSYRELEKIIVDYSNGNSREAYEFGGFTNLPARCPECKQKTKGEREQQSENMSHLHK